MRAPSLEDPLRVAFSACLIGTRCGYDGQDFPSALARRLAAQPMVRAIPFCPEHFALGTPRELMALWDGDGYDVLDGKARVLTLAGRDITEDFLRGAQAMLELVTRERVELAILTDVSPSCASHVVHKGERAAERDYRRGVGVTTAVLRRSGLRVVAQRDLRTLQELLARLEPGYVVDETQLDVEEGEWFRSYFGEG